MLMLAYLTVLSILCCWPVAVMCRYRPPAPRVPEVWADVPDMTFDYRGLV